MTGDEMGYSFFGSGNGSYTGNGSGGYGLGGSDWDDGVDDPGQNPYGYKPTPTSTSGSTTQQQSGSGFNWNEAWAGVLGLIANNQGKGGKDPKWMNPPMTPEQRREYDERWRLYNSRPTSAMMGEWAMPQLQALSGAKFNAAKPIGNGGKPFYAGPEAANIDWKAVMAAYNEGRAPGGAGAPEGPQPNHFGAANPQGPGGMKPGGRPQKEVMTGYESGYETRDIYDILSSGERVPSYYMHGGTGAGRFGPNPIQAYGRLPEPVQRGISAAADALGNVNWRNVTVDMLAGLINQIPLFGGAIANQFREYFRDKPPSTREQAFQFIAAQLNQYANQYGGEGGGEP